MLDKILAFFMLLALSPVFLIVMVFILIDDGFPVFFTQKRVGKEYSFFKMYKFVIALILGILINRILIIIAMKQIWYRD